MSAAGGGAALDVTTLTAYRCRELLARGDVSATELTRAYLDRIAAVDEQVPKTEGESFPFKTLPSPLGRLAKAPCSFPL